MATTQVMDAQSTMGIGSGFSAIMENNNAEIAKIDEFKKQPITAKQRNIIFGGMLLFVMVFFIMFASQIISGIFALIMTVMFGVGSFYGLRILKAADPLIKQKMKNYMLEKMVQEARANAARQLDNQVIMNAQRLSVARDARDKMGGAVQRLKGMIKPENKGKPIYEKKMEMLVKVEAAYKQIQEMLVKAAAANKKFEEKVQEYKDMERFANEVQAAMAFFKDSGGRKLEEMLSLEAFTHIEEEFNTALVSIENKTNDMQLDMAA
jgi:hypothetical protein